MGIGEIVILIHTSPRSGKMFETFGKFFLYILKKEFQIYQGINAQGQSLKKLIY
jgi:hypothetical protein